MQSWMSKCVLHWRKKKTEKEKWVCLICSCVVAVGHLRDPNNQLVAVRSLRICVTGVSTRPTHSGAVRSALSNAVATSQPPDTTSANVITAGDYDLNISGECTYACMLFHLYFFCLFV